MRSNNPGFGDLCKAAHRQHTPGCKLETARLHFPRAVEASCRGGASGFLAGRALWTATLGADDPTEILRERSVPRLRELGEIVDAHARPWRAKVGSP